MSAELIQQLRGDVQTADCDCERCVLFRAAADRIAELEVALAKATQPVSAGLTDDQKTELLDWVSACQSAYHIASTPGHRFGGLSGNLEENRAALVDYVNDLLSAAQRDSQPVADTSADARDAEREKAQADTRLLDAIAENYWKLDPVSLPTPGGDDADVGWRVMQYHMAAPTEREVAFVGHDDPRAAIIAAIAASREAPNAE